MGLTQSSVLSAPHTWEGVWTSTHYTGSIKGTMLAVLPKKLAKMPTDADFEVETLVKYDPNTVYRPGDSIKMIFMGRLHSSGTGNMMHNLGLTMKSAGFLQTITYRTDSVDLDAGIIKGHYDSNIPYDEGTFTLKRV